MIPKFRAFYKANQKMYEVLTLDIIDEKALIENNDNPERPLKRYVRLDEIELMQSTGLKDKNGKEIFDGDILKTRTRGLVSVRKESGNMMVTYQSGVNTRTSLTLSSFLDKYKVYVIGNIYENPELLEKR